MERMKFAEELVREFLVFRGFTSTLQCLEKELTTDIGKGFQVDKILDLIFSVYIPKFEAEKLIDLLGFFKKCFSYSDSSLIATISKLDESILRYYIVNALKCARKDKVLDFFGVLGNDLLHRDESWISWFAIPYLQKPQLDAQFRVYFSEEWFRALHLSVRNFLSEIFNGSRIPALLKLSSERATVNRLKKEIKQLNLKLSQVQTLLKEKDALLSQSRSGHEEASVSYEGQVHSTSHRVEREPYLLEDNLQVLESLDAGAKLNNRADESSSSDTSKTVLDATVVGSGDLQSEEEFPEVKTVFQDTFLGHTSPISRCRFSASGDNIASASTDGTVRIWTYDSSAPTSRNATIYCGAEIMSLEWDCKSDRLLLIGTSNGGIKVWNVDAKRVVCDLNSTEAYPSILDLKCSPVEPIFVSAAASTRQGTGYVNRLGFASLTVWNMRTWKSMAVLPLGKDPPAITSLSFNHNGKLLAAAATDGMIHMFDMSAGQQVTGWPAHDCAINSILFGPDETSIFSFGTDGNIFEWSLHNQGKITWSRNCSSNDKEEDFHEFMTIKPQNNGLCLNAFLLIFDEDSQTLGHLHDVIPNEFDPPGQTGFCNPGNSSLYRHEMALDANERELLVTSGSERAPIYQVRGSRSGMRTLPHRGSITTVDWHPTLPIFLTGSADHSVRVTSMS